MIFPNIPWASEGTFFIKWMFIGKVGRNRERERETERERQRERERFPIVSLCLNFISIQTVKLCTASLGWITSVVVLICKSLWIKASAKWINVNVNLTKSINSFHTRQAWSLFHQILLPCSREKKKFDERLHFLMTSTLKLWLIRPCGGQINSVNKHAYPVFQ